MARKLCIGILKAMFELVALSRVEETVEMATELRRSWIKCQNKFVQGAKGHWCKLARLDSRTGNMH